MGASAPVKVANSKTDDYRTVSADRDEVQQFCEKYFSDLSVNNNGSDDFGRPSEQWKNGSKEIGTYASTARCLLLREGQLQDPVLRTWAWIRPLLWM